MATEYNPNGLLDAVIERFGLKNDAALARELKIAPPVISKMRHYRLLVGDSTIVKLIEAGMSLPEIRAYVPKVTP